MTRSIPIEKCLEDAMLAYSQNGERLRPQQGYPLRLLVPGFEGNMNIKWLRRLHVTAEPAYSRDETSKYTDPMPDGTAREFTFYMEAKSIITRPSGGQRLMAPGFHEITGIAWTGRGKVRRVEVSVDDGKSWQEAQLQEPVLTRALTRFRLPWHWDGQPAVIQSRAIDETGYVQPTLAELLAVRGDNYVYHNNAIWPWRIAADGEVTQMRQAVDGRPVVWGNPVTGFRNAIAPPLVMHEDPDRLWWSEFELGEAYQGPPGWVHGGVLALVLDQLLGEAASDGLTKPLFTGTITLRYLRGTPLGKLRAEAAIERTDGHKTFVSGHMYDADGKTVEAEGIFIKPQWARDAG